MDCSIVDSSSVARLCWCRTVQTRRFRRVARERYWQVEPLEKEARIIVVFIITKEKRWLR